MKKLRILSIYLALLPGIKPGNKSAISTESLQMKVDTVKTFLALGDSYTIGEAVATDEGFPVQTVKMLEQENIHINKPTIIAVTGWTTADLLRATDLQKPGNNYDLVTLLIGVNNQYQHKSIDNYKTEFTALLGHAIAYSGSEPRHVFVLSIPDYSVTPFAANMDIPSISKEIDEFNVVNKTISKDAGVHYIDITSISRQAKYDRSLVADDGLHPSAGQYTLWSKLLASVIKDAVH